MSSYRGGTPLTRFLAEQTLGQLREMKSAVRTEIESARDRVVELEDDLARLEAAINEKSPGRGRVPQTRSPSGPQEGMRQISLRQAILAVMRDQPARVWTTQDMLEELTVRSHAPGGKTPLNTVGSRMNELVADKKISRYGRGQYTVTPPSENGPSPPDEAGDSD